MRWLFLFVWLLAGAPAFGQTMLLTGAGTAASSPSYTGPGDIVSGATAWYGLRAYNAAYAAGSVNVRRASDNVACDFNVASSGGFGVTTATCNSSTQGRVSYGTFVGSDGTASCTLAGTAAVCTGATGTVHVNDVVTGTGLTQPCIVSSASNTAPTIEIAGTTNSCGTVSVAATFTFQVAGVVTEFYDQSGNSNSLSQSTAADQPQFLPSSYNSQPSALFNGSSDYLVNSSTTSYGGLPFFSSAVAIKTGNLSSENYILTGITSGSSKPVLEFLASGTARLYCGGSLSGTASNSVLHAFQAVGATSPNAVLNIDGTETTGNCGSGAASTCIQIGAYYCGGATANWLTGQFMEGGFWGGTSPSSTLRTASCRNQQSYFGAGNFGATC